MLSAHVQEPGANDNASGVGDLSEMARVLATLVRNGSVDPKRTITMLFGLEIAQTRNFLADDSVRTRGVRWGLSLDMTGEDTKKTGGTFLIEKMPDPSAVWTRGDDQHSEWGGRPIKKERARAALLQRLPARALPRSGGGDGLGRAHESLRGRQRPHAVPQFKKPGALFWHFTDVYYHTDGDRIDKVSKAELVNVGNAALASVLTLDVGRRRRRRARWSPRSSAPRSRGSTPSARSARRRSRRTAIARRKRTFSRRGPTTTSRRSHTMTRHRGRRIVARDAGGDRRRRESREAAGEQRLAALKPLIVTDFCALARGARLELPRVRGRRLRRRERVSQRAPEHLELADRAVNVALYFVLFFRSGLYSDMGLQVVYFVLSIYGWYEWLYGGDGSNDAPVSRTTPRTLGRAVGRRRRVLGSRWVRSRRACRARRSRISTPRRRRRVSSRST